MVAALAEELKDYNPAIITGETNGDERTKAVAEFQCEKTLLFLGNIVAAGIGVTLTRGNNVLFAELTWSPSEIDQAANRCHRIGTKGAVNCYYFTVQDSIDERVIDVVMRKVKTFNSVLEN